VKINSMRLVGAVMVVGALAIGCGSSGGGTSNGAQKSDYKVLVLGGISAAGALADNAATSVLSAQAGAAAVNAAGGIDGRHVTVTVVDDQANPTTAVTKLREAIASGKPDLVLNSGPSTIATATLPILKQNNILSMNIGPTKSSFDPKQFPLNFDLSSSAGQQISAFLPYFKQKGYKSVGILHGSSSYGETYGASAQKLLTEGGFSVAANESYDIAALDMTPQLEAIMAKHPDALLLDAYGAPLGYILNGIEKLGWNVPIIGDTSVSATGLVSTPPPSGVLGTPVVANLVMQVYKSTEYDPAAAAVVQAVTRMKAIGPIKSTLILAYNYDALPLVQAAASQAGSTDPAALAKALEDPKVLQQAKTAILSRYNFTADRHDAQARPDEFAFIKPAAIKDGQFQTSAS
jgi:branched-chain amino acid transport system substrate-binding protein